MVIGNLSVTTGKGTVVLTLNTYHEGFPYAVFTPAEIEKVISVLKDHIPKAKPVKAITAKAAPPPADDDDWRDLI